MTSLVDTEKLPVLNMNIIPNEGSPRSDFRDDGLSAFICLYLCFFYYLLNKNLKKVQPGMFLYINSIVSAEVQVLLNSRFFHLHD